MLVGIVPLALILVGILILVNVIVTSHVLGLILLIVGVVLLLGGGGYYGSRRGRGGTVL